MTLDVKIIDQQLEDSLTAMKSIESTLGGLKETDLGLADACGNKELAFLYQYKSRLKEKCKQKHRTGLCPP